MRSPVLLRNYQSTASLHATIRSNIWMQNIKHLFNGADGLQGLAVIPYAQGMLRVCLALSISFRIRSANSVVVCKSTYGGCCMAICMLRIPSMMSSSLSKCHRMTREAYSPVADSVSSSIGCIAMCSAIAGGPHTTSVGSSVGQIVICSASALPGVAHATSHPSACSSSCSAQCDECNVPSMLTKWSYKDSQIPASATPGKNYPFVSARFLHSLIALTITAPQGLKVLCHQSRRSIHSRGFPANIWVLARDGLSCLGASPGLFSASGLISTRSPLFGILSQLLHEILSPLSRQGPTKAYACTYMDICCVVRKWGLFWSSIMGWVVAFTNGSELRQKRVCKGFNLSKCLIAPKHGVSRRLRPGPPKIVLFEVAPLFCQKLWFPRTRRIA